MRAMGLLAKAGRKYKVTTDSGHAHPVAANLLGQDFSCDTSTDSTSHAKAPDQVWLSDITYLWTGEGWQRSTWPTWHSPVHVGHVERCQHHLTRHVRLNGPAYNAPGEQVQHAAHIEPAFARP